ncbi:unnamed protein product [Pseudo-nitzschia multistriata]|uniref:Uncharacterized protein n=1 Tax=Pseudo-nitzschia multistriata TaxID=183589 RepID=A0A448ZJS2_9STRA|nr:unnamed protein product [Pseudo-nitzschia multistriata]
MFSQSRLILQANKNAIRATASAIPSTMKMTTAARILSTASSIPSWATVDPKDMGIDPEPHAVRNLVDGKWQPTSSETIVIPHPLDANAPPIFTIPDTQILELDPFYESLRKVPKSGLHNPLKNPERYVHYGEISRKAGAALSDPKTAEFFTHPLVFPETTTAKCPLDTDGPTDRSH